MIRCRLVTYSFRVRCPMLICPLVWSGGLRQHRRNGRGLFRRRRRKCQSHHPDTDRDTSNDTTTNESGNFIQRYLIVGNYRVRVEAPGFKPPSKTPCRSRSMPR